MAGILDNVAKDNITIDDMQNYIHELVEQKQECTHVFGCRNCKYYDCGKCYKQEWKQK